MFNVAIDLVEQHFMLDNKDCYYKIWICKIMYAVTADGEATVETQQFNTRREGLLWATRRMHEIFTV